MIDDFEDLTVTISYSSWLYFEISIFTAFSGSFLSIFMKVRYELRYVTYFELTYLGQTFAKSHRNYILHIKLNLYYIVMIYILSFSLKHITCESQVATEENGR